MDFDGGKLILFTETPFETYVPWEPTVWMPSSGGVSSKTHNQPAAEYYYCVSIFLLYGPVVYRARVRGRVAPPRTALAHLTTTVRAQHYHH